MAKEQFTNAYALLIAVNENLVSNYALPTVARDAAALRKVLVHPERCAYPEENVRMLTGSDASRDGIYNGLSWLKQRIAGPFGHLDNEDSGRLLGQLDCSRLKHLIGAHLSESNNRPDLARAALARGLGCEHSWIGLASQDAGFDWREA